MGGCNLSKFHGRKSKSTPMSQNDPHSFSNPEISKVVHMDIFWTVDFERKVITGRIMYDLEIVDKTTQHIILDTNGLIIKSVSSISDTKHKNRKLNNPLEFELGDPVANYGQPLSIDIAELIEISERQKLERGRASGRDLNEIKIQIEYETNPECKALQFLDKEKTLGKQYPFMFSQCQMIYARCLLPCQDTPSTKATYTAEVTIPQKLKVLMSAMCIEKVKVNINNTVFRRFKFRQKIPIPSYLIGIAVGHLECKYIGQQSKVFAEEQILEAAVQEFQETDEMLEATETLLGRYVWGACDILVLPPSFPFDLMQLPGLTFVTPTLLAGDRSLAYNICHEIAHSWIGNLVTIKNFQHLWLNEGLAVFVERKILGALKGESYRQFVSICGWRKLSAEIKNIGTDNPLTKLVLDLTDLNPDDAFNQVICEKGYVFLYYLEQKVGGPEKFELFLKSYIEANKSGYVDTDMFKTQLKNYFKKMGLNHLIRDVDWNTWLYSPGMPPIKPDYDTTMIDICVQLKNRWIKWKTTDPPDFFKTDLTSFIPLQIEEFLNELLEESEPLELKKVQDMQKIYDFNSRKNCEIRFRWLRICIRSKWSEQVPLVLQFVSEQGRIKFLLPLYRDLYDWEESRQMAIDNFNVTRSDLTNICSCIVAKSLNL